MNNEKFVEHFYCPIFRAPSVAHRLGASDVDRWKPKINKVQCNDPDDVKYDIRYQ